MADGLALLVAPEQVIARVRQTLSVAPSLLRWEAVAATLGVLLLVGAQGLRYQPLWALAGLGMIVKGLFLGWGPSRWRDPLVGWCLHREPVDYRFWGLGLCTLAVLLLHALGWLGNA
jgi:hypothetical protein